MKKKILFTLCIFAVSITGCKNNDNKIKKIGDYLYEYTLTDDTYWEKTGINVPSYSAKAFGCSGVQNGKYRGRNYDWYYGNSDLCVVKAPKTAKRDHASVGLCDCSFIAHDENGKYNISKINYEQLPFTMVDGINDAGVCIQVNVIPYGEIFTKENHEFYHTPDKTDDLIDGHRVVRYILDFADSVDHAIQLLDEKDVYPAMGEKEEFHWMISGPTSKTDPTIKTVVIEFFPNKDKKDMRVTDTFVENKPIMTNFNLYNFNFFFCRIRILRIHVCVADVVYLNKIYTPLCIQFKTGIIIILGIFFVGI